MEHFIIIPFNLQWEGQPITYEGDSCWVKQRLAIFKKYCVKAFVNQTDPNFHLILYCDNTTPDPYRSELLELEIQYEFIHICWEFSKFYGEEIKSFVDDGKEIKPFTNSILNNIKSLISSDVDEVICSRFNNDDIPEVRYNEFIKLAHQHHNIISLAKGLYWDIKNHYFLDSTFPTGPFVSVKSKLDNFTSPLEGSHHDYVTKKGGIPLITEENLWIQLIHGDNLWNRIDRMPGQHIPPPSDEYLKIHFAYE